METVNTLPKEDSMKIYNAEASIFLNYPILTSLTDIVMEIPTNNKDLQRIILSDPIISKYSVKAEGYLLLVEVSNRIKVAAALKKYGYLL